MKLTEYLSAARVVVLDAPTKEKAIEQMLELFAGHPAVGNARALAEGIWEREHTLPTGLGLGIGVPHVRLSAVRAPVAALGVLRTGVDYGSLDRVPVRILLMVAMPAGAQKEYLTYLAKATRLFQDQTFRESLLVCDSSEALWETLKNQDP